MGTPYDANTHLIKNRGDLMAKFEYASIIRGLMHLLHVSRPNLAYVVCRLRRYIECQ